LWRSESGTPVQTISAGSSGNRIGSISVTILAAFIWRRSVISPGVRWFDIHSKVVACPLRIYEGRC
jgi:hypothetical protein